MDPDKIIAGEEVLLTGKEMQRIRLQQDRYKAEGKDMIIARPEPGQDGQPRQLQFNARPAQTNPGQKKQQGPLISGHDYKRLMQRKEHYAAQGLKMVPVKGADKLGGYDALEFDLVPINQTAEAIQEQIIADLEKMGINAKAIDIEILTSRQGPRRKKPRHKKKRR